MRKEDILTGFLVREELVPYINKLINEHKPFTLVLMDLNNFKKYNDKYGHLFGDEILKYVASTIKLTFSGEGEVFRYGGDEFILIFPKKDKKRIYSLFKVYNKNLQRRPFLYEQKLFRITASYGMATYPLDAKTPKTLIDKADKAMYFSKKRGRGVVSDIAKIRNIKLVRFIIKIIFLGIFVLLIFLLSKNTERLKGFIYNMSYSRATKLEKKSNIITGEKMSESVLKEFSQPVSINVNPYPCKVTLKNGQVLKGYIVHRDEKKITLEISTPESKGYITIDKALILEVR